MRMHARIYYGIELSTSMNSCSKSRKKAQRNVSLTGVTFGLPLIFHTVNVGRKVSGVPQRATSTCVASAQSKTLCGYNCNRPSD